MADRVPVPVGDRDAPTWTEDSGRRRGREPGRVDRADPGDLAALGTFSGSEGALFLCAVVTGDLLTLHTRMRQALSGQPVTHWPYYLPGR